MQIKKNEMGLGEVKEAKGRMEVALRQSQGHEYELQDRIRRVEEGVKVKEMASLTAHELLTRIIISN